jgi:ATP-dependent Clp protease adaptor protein ClpS
MANADTKVSIKPNLKLNEPKMYKVIYKNDDKTTMEFVVESLMVHFNHTGSNAMSLMQQIHIEGSAVVAVLPHELAEQKGIEVTLEAKSQGFPLVVKIESEA